jgi:hypothetical protein
MANTPLFGGLETRTMIPQIVQVGAVHNDRDSQLIGLFSTNFVELVFAEKTSVRWILGKRRIGEFLRVEDDMSDAEAGSELLRGCQLPGRYRRGRCR